MRILLPALAVLMTTTASAALAQQVPAPILTTPEAKDVWTHAQPQVARVTHVGLDLTADFAKKTMRGTATLDVLAARNAREVILDIDDLVIASVTNAAGKPLPYTVGQDDAELARRSPFS